MTNPKPLIAMKAELRRRLWRIDSSTDAGRSTPLADADAMLVGGDPGQAAVKPDKVIQRTDVSPRQAAQSASHA